MHYGPFSDAYKQAMLSSTETRHIYFWKEQVQAVAPTDEMKQSIKAAKKYNLADGSTEPEA